MSMSPADSFGIKTLAIVNNITGVPGVTEFTFTWVGGVASVAGTALTGHRSGVAEAVC